MKHIFLDIEKTLIESIDNPIAINHDVIAKMLDGQKEVFLFTFGKGISLEK